MQKYQTQRESQQLDLNKIALFLSVFLLLFSSQIANYNTTVDESWFIWKNIMYFNFTLMFFTLRKEVVKIIGMIGYKIIIYTLLNYFIDQYCGYTDWTWNDFITVGFILLELIFKKIKNDKLRIENIRDIVHTIKRKFTKRSK